MLEGLGGGAGGKGPVWAAPAGEEPRLDGAQLPPDARPAEARGDAVLRLGPAAAVELYSPPRVTALGLPTGLVRGSTFDLQADEAGVAWDFTKPADRKRAWQRIRAEEPFLVGGSPPCTMFSRLQPNLNAKKTVS